MNNLKDIYDHVLKEMGSFPIPKENIEKLRKKTYFDNDFIKEGDLIIYVGIYRPSVKQIDGTYNPVINVVRCCDRQLSLFELHEQYPSRGIYPIVKLKNGENKEYNFNE